MPNYSVKFKVNNTTSSRVISLKGGMESEAIAKLKQQIHSLRDKDIIILEIKQK